MVAKVLHQCTANVYRNFFNQSSSQQLLKVAIPLIAGAIALYAYWRWTATTGTNDKKTDPIVSDEPISTKIGTIHKNLEHNDIKSLDKFRSSEKEYTRLTAIMCTAANSGMTTSPLIDADSFFDAACDDNGDIRLWDNDNPRKLQKANFMTLAGQWIKRGGNFFYPQEGKPIVVDYDTVCSPWCHEGKNRSAVVFDYLMRAGQPKTLLPEGAKNGHLYPNVEDVEDAEDDRYPVLENTTGFQHGKIFRLGDKFKSEKTDCQQGFTTLFNQLATLNKPVMLFAFVSAVPILMREIMKRTGDADLNNITIVGFHYDDPMAVESPMQRAQAKASDDWVVKNKLAAKLEHAQLLQGVWNTNSEKNAQLRKAGRDEQDPERIQLARLCSKTAEQKAPLEQELFYYRRSHAVIRFQNEVLAKLIVVKKTQDLEI